MSDRITKLDDATIRKIAAGEVVERPASVVKELVENSLDADADRIDVTVEAGGTDRIAVSDDGVGMSEADLRTAVQEHTTSKIRDADDLDSGVTTLGFRGEALHTIGAVSRVTVTSKPRGDVREGTSRARESESPDGRGTELRMEDGEVESVGPAGRPEGTTVEVADLFYNTPARRKYLKTTTTEFSHVNTVVTRYALANPDVAVSLTHGDREVFATSGRGDLQSALLSVYGREVATSMIAVGEARSVSGSEATGGSAEERRESAGTSERRAATPRAEAGDGPVSVSGYVSDPETTRSTREYMSAYVNGRYVSSAAVRDAVLAAYGGQLSTERYPFAVLFIDVAPGGVDVNVHPRKMEVRWEDESAVRNAVETAVESALLDHGLVRSSAPRGRSIPDEAPVEPERGDSEQAELGTGPTEAEREQSTLDAKSDATISDATDSKTGTETADEAGSSRARSRSGASGRTSEGVGAQTSAGTDASAATDADSSSQTDAPPADANAPATDADRGASAGEAGRDRRGSRTTPESTHFDPNPDRKFAAPTDAETLAGEPTPDPEFDALPRMEILGQLHDTYVVAETPDGLVLVDQHAADERVNYERLRAEFADDATTQMLAQPVELELTAGEAAVFEEYREALERLGFRAERAEQRSADGASGEAASQTDDRTVAVRTAPTVLDTTLDPELLRDALGEFVSTDADDRGDTVEAVADDLLADLACYPSITGNTSLREGSVVDLLAALDGCENPYACPHGRPVIIEFGREEIEDRFERDYPGHAGRRGEED